KTITLLELARELISRAENDVQHPVPVILNLSTWLDTKQSLDAWLAGELASKYFVPQATGRVWLQQNSLLLLLDGLDEVRAQHRASCVEAINRFAEERGVAGIAICSRLKEYCDLPVRLRLGGAIRLLPLTAEQTSDYLAAAGTRLSALRLALQEDASLR